MLDILLLCFVYLVAESATLDTDSEYVKETYYYASDNVSSLRDSECELATPQLKYNATGVWVRDPNNFSQLSVSQTYWIGYYYAFASFQYIGCTAFSQNARNVTQTLGLCFSACHENDFVAILGNDQTPGVKCLCLNGTEIQNSKLTGRNCGKTCDGYIPCGKNNGNFSVYKIDRENKTGNPSQASRCYAMIKRYTDVSFSWKSCKEKYDRLCNQENFTDKSEARAYHGSNVWKATTNTCLKKQLYPAAIKSARRLSSNSEPNLNTSWTGILASKAVFHRVPETPVSDVQYAYMNTSSGEVFFTDTGEHHSLCVGRKTKTSTENLTSVVITTSDSLYSESFKWQSSTSQMLTAITTDGEEKTILDKHSGELTVPDKSTIGFVAGASAGAVVLVVIAVVLVLLFKRGNFSKSFKSNLSKKKENGLTGISSPAYMDSTPSDLNHIDKPNNTSNDFVMIEKVADAHTPVTTYNANKSIVEEKKDDFPVYNNAKVLADEKKTDIEDVYNELDTEQTYSMIDNSAKVNNLEKTPDTSLEKMPSDTENRDYDVFQSNTEVYDHITNAANTVQANANSENVYDKTNTLLSANQTLILGDDPYNHLDLKGVNTGADNDENYDHTCQFSVTEHGANYSNVH